jgi:hypothetical protein
MAKPLRWCETNHPFLPPRHGISPIHIPPMGQRTMTDTTGTSSKRAEANRRNSKRSTGPTSQSGKSKTRFNALKHGMRARLPLLPGEDGGAFRARLDAWTVSLEPRDDLERYLVERAVNVSWQLDRADRAWAARLQTDLLASGSARAIAQADEVLDLGRRLFWEPRGPVSSSPRAARPGPRGCAPPGRMTSSTATSRPGCSTAWRARRRAAPGCSIAGTSCGTCWRTGWRGSRTTSSRRRGCWGGSRWRRSMTDGCGGSTWPPRRWTRSAGTSSRTSTAR